MWNASSCCVAINFDGSQLVPLTGLAKELYLDLWLQRADWEKALTSYRRVRITGGCFFFTVCLADRRATTLVDRMDDLKAAWRWTQGRLPFSSPAWVVLPDHIHCIWKLPPEDDDYAIRWSLLKRHFTQAVRKSSHVPNGKRKGERGIWQRRFWEHAIREERDLENHFKYIRGNPVRHGLVQNIEDWPHSSFHIGNRRHETQHSTPVDHSEK